MTKELHIWKHKFPQKTFHFYNPKFITFFNKLSIKSRIIKKNKSFQTFTKTHNYNKFIINHKIDAFYLNQYGFSQTLKSNIEGKKNTVYSASEPCLSLNKELFFIATKKSRQYHFFLNEFIQSLITFNKTLIREQIYLFVKTPYLQPVKHENMRKNLVQIFSSNYKSSFFIPQPKFYEVTCKKSQLYLINFILKLFLYFLIEHVAINSTNITRTINIYTRILKMNWKNKFIFNSNSIITLSFNYINRIKKMYSNFFSNTVLPSYIWKKIIYNNLHLQTSSRIFIWKKTNNLAHKSYQKLLTRKQKTFFIFPKNKFQSYTTARLIKKNTKRHNNFTQILYILLRLEDKIEYLSKIGKNQDSVASLLKLYNFLNYNLLKKENNNSFNGLILANAKEIFKIKKKEWRVLFLKVFTKWFQEKKIVTNVQKLYTFYKKIENNFNPSSQVKKSIKKQIDTKKFFHPFNKNKTRNLFSHILASKKRKQRSIINARKIFDYERLVFNHNYLNHTQIKEIFSIISQKNIKIFYINALSLTKYAFNLERLLEKREKRSPRLFLQTIDRDLINKHKYIGIYIKDLIRVCFIGMFFKNARFIAKYLAFQIGARPHNRKETSFIRFIIKVAKTFAAEREEISGFRISFKGRVNRWRRTKAIIGSRGVLPFHTIDNRIECGSAQAINRKGALGIRIWIRYKPSFSTLLKQSILKYFAYSKQLQVKKTLLRKIYFNKKHR